MDVCKYTKRIYIYISIVEKSIISYFKYFTRKTSWLVTDHDYRPSFFLMLIPILQIRHVFTLAYLSYYSHIVLMCLFSNLCGITIAIAITVYQIAVWIILPRTDQLEKYFNKLFVKLVEVFVIELMNYLSIKSIHDRSFHVSFIPTKYVAHIMVSHYLDCN